MKSYWVKGCELEKRVHFIRTHLLTGKGYVKDQAKNIPSLRFILCKKGLLSSVCAKA